MAKTSQKNNATVTYFKAVVDVHVWRGKRLVRAPHPAARISPEDWVDSVIEAAKWQASDS